MARAGIYIAEAYTPKARSIDVEAAAERAAAAALEMNDETCFHLFEAETADRVREAVDLAGIRYERIVETRLH
ncbi:MAG: hypothetical protein ACRDLE_06525 [Gaiellaceae bacterium]